MNVARCGPSEIDRCVATLTLAFSTDPPCRRVWPDSQKYVESFPNFVRTFAGRAFEVGSAYYVGEFAGVALWLPPNVAPDEQAIGDLIQRCTSDDVQAAMYSMFEQIAAHHPNEPHWYLPLIGVDPVSQKCGLGSALLNEVLAECDRQSTLAYLEASCPRNVGLYKRHGFEEVGGIQAGSSPTIVPMVRQPRQGGKASGYRA